MNTQHKHHNLMALFFENYKTNTNEVDNWEFGRDGTWYKVIGYPTWDTSFEYRRNPPNIHQDLIDEYEKNRKLDPKEQENWEFNVGSGWERARVWPKFKWCPQHQYRRNPLSGRPEENLTNKLKALEQRVSSLESLNDSHPHYTIVWS